MRVGKSKRFWNIMIVMIALLLILCFVSINAGYTKLSVGDVIRILLGRGSAEEKLILYDFRLVRIVLPC